MGSDHVLELMLEFRVGDTDATCIALPRTVRADR